MKRPKASNFNKAIGRALMANLLVDPNDVKAVKRLRRRRTKR